MSCIAAEGCEYQALVASDLAEVRITLRVAARGSGQVRGDPAGVRAGRLGVPAGQRAGPDRGAEAAGDPIAVLPVLPVLFHLLW